MIVRDIECALRDSVGVEGAPGYTEREIAKSALVHLIRRVERREQPYQIVELGGGQSTLFFQSLLKLELLDICVRTLSHHRENVESLKGTLEDGEGRIQVHLLPLQQVTDVERKLLFAEPDLAMERWPTLGHPLLAREYHNYTIKNVFYGNLHTLNWESNGVDILIVDGPNGDGRGLAYPLLTPFLREGSLVLIDDFDHYPFLDDLRSIFVVEEQYREIVEESRWVLVRIVKRHVGKAY
ncbi:hypothetical protein [Pasteuria penetrans]|uniref:hypothetical protein n=1 Tax=Pasteuria penetrans TaxID=86005 RepID=UPI000FA6CA95|nr:hypothetical protein [Pasteuria penetrans]